MKPEPIILKLTKAEVTRFSRLSPDPELGMPIVDFYNMLLAKAGYKPLEEQPEDDPDGARLSYQTFAVNSTTYYLLSKPFAKAGQMMFWLSFGPRINEKLPDYCVLFHSHMVPSNWLRTDTNQTQS